MWDSSFILKIHWEIKAVYVICAKYFNQLKYNASKALYEEILF